MPSLGLILLNLILENHSTLELQKDHLRSLIQPHPAQAWSTRAGHLGPCPIKFLIIFNDGNFMNFTQNEVLKKLPWLVICAASHYA